MKRTKFNKKGEIKRHLSVLYNVVKVLYNMNAEYYMDVKDVWHKEIMMSDEENQENLNLIKQQIRKAVMQFIRNNYNDHEKINTHIKKLHPSTVSVIKNCLTRERYKHFFRGDHEALPTQLAMPNIFAPIAKRMYSKIENQTTVLEYGKTKIEINGKALTTEDSKTIAALVQILRKKRIKETRTTISFHTSKREILKEKGIKNIRDLTSQEVVWQSLKRIHQCAIEINSPERDVLFHILDRAERLKEDKNQQIKINLSKDFLQLYGAGFASISPKEYYKLPDKQANLLFFLRSQVCFSKYGYYGGWHGVSIFKLYEWLGFHCFTPIEKIPAYKLRGDLKKQLNSLIKLGHIGRYEIKKDRIKIWKKANEELAEQNTVDDEEGNTQKIMSETMSANEMDLDDDFNEKVYIKNTEKK